MNNSKMKKRPLGKTGLLVSEISLGGGGISSWGAEYEDAKKAIHCALDMGINYIDTAPMYANSEEVLGKVLGGRIKDVILSTKLGFRPDSFDPKNKTHLRQSFEESLRLLKRDDVDILMIHEPDRKRQIDWWTDHAEYEGPVLEFMHELKEKGLIRFLGLGGTTAYEMARIIHSGKFAVVLTAFNYSPLWREAEHEVLPSAKAQNMGIVSGSPLQQGALAKRYDVENTSWLSAPRKKQYLALYQFLDEINMALPEFCLRFVLSNLAIATVLTGARSAAEVEQNIAAVAKGPLPQDVLGRLDEISAMVPFRPFDEPFILPFGREYAGNGKASR